VFHYANIIAEMDDGRIIRTDRNTPKETQA